MRYLRVFQIDKFSYKFPKLNITELQVIEVLQELKVNISWSVDEENFENLKLSGNLVNADEFVEKIWWKNI